jgi:hypothetical protein
LSGFADVGLYRESTTSDAFNLCSYTFDLNAGPSTNYDVSASFGKG